MNTGATEQEQRAYEWAKKRVAEIRGFYIHLMVYVVVSIGLFAINMLTSPSYLWFLWPLIGWGVFVVLNALVVFGGGLFGSAWEERKIHQLMEDETRHQAHPLA